MKKLEVIDICDCLNKLLIVGYLRQFDCDEKSFNYYLGEIVDGQIVMKMDIVVDNSWYDEFENYHANFDIVSSYYPIVYCPVCGKRIEYNKTLENSLKLV